MPAAVARKRQHSSATEDQIRSPHRRPTRSPQHGHGLAHGHSPRSKSSVPTTPARPRHVAHDESALESQALASQPNTYSHTDVYDESLEELREKARAARRRARRAHRPLRWSWSTGLGIMVVLGQLVALLWLQGLALSARNRSYALDKEITQVQENVSRTQKEIAALDSSPQIKQWARERGWSVATQDKLDPVTQGAAVSIANPQSTSSGQTSEGSVMPEANHDDTGSSMAQADVEQPDVDSKVGAEKVTKPDKRRQKDQEADVP